MPVPVMLRAAAALVLAALCGSLQAQAPLRTYSACCQYGWAVADLPDIDGDGLRDFVVGANASGQVYAHSSARAGTFWVATFSGTDFGYALSSAGDVDRDGSGDVIAGAPSHQGRGAIRVLSGRNGDALGQLLAPEGSTRFGAAVAGLGDLDGDGASDFAVGAPGGAGRVHLYSGADGSAIATIEAPLPNGEFGAGLGAVRDLDGDGRSDLIVGAPGAGTGRAYAYSSATRAVLLELAPATGGGRFGEFFVADAGDVDADARTDLYVGAYDESGGNGAGYVFSGRSGALLHLFRGAAGEGMGPGRHAGDVDGDGHADIVVGSYTYGGDGIPQAGRVTVFGGRDARVLQRASGMRAGGQLGFDAVGLGDVSGDGRLDFIAAGAGGNSVELHAGTVDRAPTLAMNAGLSGAWAVPGLSGQGFVFDVQPEANYVAGAGFTHATLPPDVGPEQRWFTLVGPIVNDIARLEITDTRGGRFDAGVPVLDTVVGSMQLRFESCTRARAQFSIRRNAVTGAGAPDQGPMLTEEFELQRVTPDSRCGELGARRDR
jgi:hypothetical protein